MRKLVLALLIVSIILSGCGRVKENNLIDLEGNPVSGQDPPGGNTSEEDPESSVDREGLLQVIVMCEDWGNHFRDLFDVVDNHSWAMTLDREILKRATEKALANYPKFIQRYQTAALPEEYVSLKAEIINLTNEMHGKLQELDSAIANNKHSEIYNLRPVFADYKKSVMAHQTHYTDYLTERVHLLPETHYPPLAKEYYLTLIGFDDMTWIRNYIGILFGEGRRPYSLEKLKGHAERVLPQAEALYNNHRFLNVPQRFGASNYVDIVDFSARHLDSLRDLITAIEMNDLEAVDDALEYIQLAQRYLNSEIRPFM